MTRTRAGMIGFAALIGGVLSVLALFGPSWWAERLMRPNDDGLSSPQRPRKSADEIRTFFAGLAPELRQKGVRPETLERATAAFTLDEEIATLNLSQPEHIKTAGEYVALLVSDARIANGRARLVEHADLFDQIQQRYGVDKHVVAAIWGVESSFGTSMGERNVVRSLATLAMTDERRGSFWRNELIAALTILERGDIGADAMTGSWAGAMGHTQFMPSTYLAYAVDFDGDGRRDIWNRPGDALASAANYLKVSGWRLNQPAVVEVILPPAFDHAQSAPGISNSLDAWLAMGVRVAGAAPAQTSEQLGPLSLVLPAGYAGPAFLTGANFQAILRYNRAVSYALAVSLLADQLAGRPVVQAAWPLSDKALSKAEREEMQQLLTRLGHDAGPADGIIGTGTRGAIRAYQKATALPQDGHPSQGLLEHLRNKRIKLPE